jgi:hypothetical protein
MPEGIGYGSRFMNLKKKLSSKPDTKSKGRLAALKKAAKKHMAKGKMMALLIMVAAAQGCIMAGELRRCYGLAVPFVKVGICERIEKPTYRLERVH